MNSTTTLSMLTLAAGFACVPLAVCGFAAAWLCGVGACMMLLPFRGRSSLWRRRSTSDNDLLFGGGFLEDKGGLQLLLKFERWSGAGAPQSGCNELLFYSVFGSFIHGGKLEMTIDRCEFGSILHSSLLGLDMCESMYVGEDWRDTCPTASSFCAQ